MRVRFFKAGHIIDEFEFNPGPLDRRYTFGRSVDCSVQLDFSPSISRTQATIVRRGDGWGLIDGNESGASATGVWVDGVRIVGEVLICAGQDIRLFSSRGSVIELFMDEVADSALDRTEIPSSLRSVVPTVQRSGLAVAARSGVPILSDEIGAVKRSIKEIQAAIDGRGKGKGADDSGLNEIRSLVQGQGQRIDSIGQRLDQVHETDAAQDAKLRKVITALTGLLVVVVIITSGRSDADELFNRILSVASGAGAIGGGASLITKSDRTP